MPVARRGQRERGGRHANVPPHNAFKFLAAAVLHQAAIDVQGGQAVAQHWIRSAACKWYCDALDVSHEEYIARVERGEVKGYKVHNAAHRFHLRWRTNDEISSTCWTTSGSHRN